MDLIESTRHKFSHTHTISKINAIPPKNKLDYDEGYVLDFDFQKPRNSIRPRSI